MVRVLSLIFCGLTGANAFAAYTLSELEYARLTGTERREYVGGLRTAYNEYEKAYAQQPDYYAFFDVFAKAHAAGPRDLCPVGGLLRYTMNGHCPTRGRNCEGKADGFTCGRLYGSSCIDRQPTETLSDRCLAASPVDITSDKFAEINPILQDAASRSCAKRKAPPQCGPLLKKMSDLYSKYKRPALAQANPVGPKAETVAFEKRGACGPPAHPDRLQAEHACVACAFDYAIAQANPDAKIPFKSSTNWLMMLNGVRGACDLSDIDTNMYAKVNQHATSVPDELGLVASFGTCSESSFKHHSAFVQGKESDKEEWNVSLVKYQEEKAKAAASKGSWSAPDPNYPDHFSERFGITMRQAYDLFCPDAKKLTAMAPTFEARLNKMKGNLSPEFVKCATEALVNRKKLKLDGQQVCKPQDLANSGNVALDLRAAIKKANGPLPVTIKEGNATSCAIVTGFDNEGFAMNSNGGAYKIKNAALAKVAISTVEPTCPVISSNVVRTADQSKPTGPIEPTSAHQ